MHSALSWNCAAESMQSSRADSVRLDARAVRPASVYVNSTDVFQSDKSTRPDSVGFVHVNEPKDVIKLGAKRSRKRVLCNSKHNCS